MKVFYLVKNVWWPIPSRVWNFITKTFQICYWKTNQPRQELSTSIIDIKFISKKMHLKSPVSMFESGSGLSLGRWALWPGQAGSQRPSDSHSSSADQRIWWRTGANFTFFLAWTRLCLWHGNSQWRGIFCQKYHKYYIPVNNSNCSKYVCTVNEYPGISLLSFNDIFVQFYLTSAWYVHAYWKF